MPVIVIPSGASRNVGNHPHGHTLWQINLGMDPAQVNLGAVHISALNAVVQKM